MLSSSKGIWNWVPAGLFGLGFLLLLRVGDQQVVTLRGNLADLPTTITGYTGTDLELSPAEREVAGVEDYLNRLFIGPDSTLIASLYVGFYRSQVQGKTIHSPKNCLPGAGWEPISAGERMIQVGNTSYPVNRYILGKNTTRALVYYWYQGRGRISANEYRVKWELLRDKAMTGRSEEALVRIVVPMRDGEEEADRLAEEIAKTYIGPLFETLPTMEEETTTS